MKLSIIIPVYNEERSIGIVLQKIKDTQLQHSIKREIIIVDDGSTDRTTRILDRYKHDPEIRLFRFAKNSGKSTAVRYGIEKSTGDVILIQDADLEYNPRFYSRLLGPIIKKDTSIVYGSRFKGNITNMKKVNQIANIIAVGLFNRLYKTNLSDITTGYRLFRKETLDKINLKSKNFLFEVEITAKFLKNGYLIYEVPIDYTARSRKEGKKITWLHALENLCGIIRFRVLNN